MFLLCRKYCSTTTIYMSTYTDIHVYTCISVYVDITPSSLSKRQLYCMYVCTCDVYVDVDSRERAPLSVHSAQRLAASIGRNVTNTPR